MSVLSLIRRGRQAAKEHQAKQAEKQKKEAEQTPYRHVPKHALIDAMGGGPASWREDDRVKIMEQNRRRSAMTASGLGMGGVSTHLHGVLPRANSSLSQYVSYPNANATPVVQQQMPRSYSYNGFPARWSSQGGEMMILPSQAPLTAPASIKGKEVDRVSPVDPGRRSSRSSLNTSNERLPSEKSSSSLSKGRAQPVPGSSGESWSSQEELSLKPVRRSTNNGVAVKPGSSRSSVSASPAHLHPAAAAEADYFGRVHGRRHSRASDSLPHSSSQPLPYSHKTPRQGGQRVMSLPATPAGMSPPVMVSSQAATPGSHYILTPQAPWAANATSSSAASWANAATAGLDMLGSATSSLYSSQRVAAATLSSSSSRDSEAPRVRAPPLSHQNRKIPSTHRYGDFEQVAPTTLPSNDQASTIPRSYVPEPYTSRSYHHEASVPVNHHQQHQYQHQHQQSNDNFSLPFVQQLSPVNQLPPVQQLPPTKSSGKLSKTGGGKLLRKNRFSIKASG